MSNADWSAAHKDGYDEAKDDVAALLKELGVDDETITKVKNLERWTR